MVLLAVFLMGAAFSVLLQLFLLPVLYPKCSSGENRAYHISKQESPGSTTVHRYPPAAPSNPDELFPTRVGFPGPTPTGGEPALIFTAPAGYAYPTQGVDGKLPLPAKGKNLYDKWGNLSLWRTVEGEELGSPDASREVPEECEVVGLHFLHRHGARYPTNHSYFGGPSMLAARLHGKSWTASGDLKFLNSWTFKLGEEVLTPIGRQQMYDLGVALRLKYGTLLEHSTQTGKLPVWRTESQDRMLASNTNLALGFFGWPLDLKRKFNQVVTIESVGFNNTLAPYKNCPTANVRANQDSLLTSYPSLQPESGIHHDRDILEWEMRGAGSLAEWANIYLKDAHKRIQKMMDGFELSLEDVYRMQEMCAYETVALGYSAFCPLFTEEEWEGFSYALDLFLYHTSSFGSPLSVPFGAGYLAEMLARLTHTPIAVHNISTNSTLDDDERTFPLNEKMYVDSTHEVVVLYVLTALNLTTFNEDLTGGMPFDKLKKDRRFRTNVLAPFGTHVQFQLLSCSDPSASSTQRRKVSTDDEPSHIRILVNDGVARPPEVCFSSSSSSRSASWEEKQGLCPVDEFVSHLKNVVGSVDWATSCGFSR